MSLASLKNLCNLTIILIPTLPQLLKITFKYLKRIRTLKHLTISGLSFSASNITIFSAGLLELHQICSLKLPSCSVSKEYSEDLINALTLTLPKLPFLTEIDIRFNGSFDVANYTKKLFYSFGKMKALSDITLSLGSTWTEYPNDSGLSFLYAPGIRKLKVNPQCRLTKDSLVKFSQTLKNFTSLETFEIALTSYSPLEKTGPAALFATLSSLVSLSSITLILCLKPEDEGIVESLVSFFENVKKLVRLKLQFEGNTPFHEERIRPLFSSLRCLESLRYLTMNCFQPGMKDQYLEILGESLKELLQLRSLSLNFADLTNYGVEALTSGVKTLMNLRDITLSVQKKNNLDNMTIHQIREILNSLPCLYSVDFDFLLGSKITCFDELFKVLKQAKNIGEVALTIPDQAMKSKEIQHLMESKAIKRMLTKNRF